MALDRDARRGAGDVLAPTVVGVDQHSEWVVVVADDAANDGVARLEAPHHQVAFHGGVEAHEYALERLVLHVQQDCSKEIFTSAVSLLNSFHLMDLRECTYCKFF